MAVQAQQCLSHAFLPHELGQAFRLLDGAAGGGCGGVWFDELGGGCAPGGIGDAVFGQPRSEVTCNGNNDIAAFLPRKRARVAPSPPPSAGLMELGQQGLSLPLAFPQGHMFAVDVQSRAVECGAASTSGRSAATNGGGACLSQGVVSQLCHHGAEVDALVRLETERMRLGLQEARQRHLRAVVAAVERAAAGRLRAAEAEAERARQRNAELEERLRQLAAEGQAWLGVAKSHEAVAAGLRATFDQLLRQQPAVGGGDLAGVDAEDAQSCCFEAATAACVADDAASGRKGAHPSCKSCGTADACVLLLPCRHLCLCRACEPAADSCPVCAATKNASLQVLLS